MSQIFSQVLGQHLRMEQRLTPQLIQSMSILQKPVTDLEACVAEALETNAALEIEEDLGDINRANGRHDRRRDEDHQSETGFARLDRFSRDFREFGMNWGDGGPPTPRRSSVGEDRDPKLAAMANTADRSESLQEHLLQQWSLFDLQDDALRRAGEAIINHLDQDGYLRVRLDEIAATARPPLSVAVLERALTEVHQLEPAGIGARDVVECLLLQLDALPGDNTIERTLIRSHLDDIIHNRLPAVSRATGYSVGEITEAIRAMRSTLYLHPGYLVVDRTVPPVRPDVIVEYADNGGLDLRAARGNMPRLRVSEEIALLAKNKENGKESRDFARKQMEEAGALIDAIRFRHDRLMEVSLAIVTKQKEFFDIGPQGLKVLRMSDLAAELGCDPSTISRTVADKYMQTPRGIYPLRYFFTGGTETQDGESVGWDRVKDRVREVVAAEDKGDPLNDDQIAEILKKEGIAISRRTVAKYRAQLNIPAARQRKTF